MKVKFFCFSSIVLGIASDVECGRKHKPRVKNDRTIFVVGHISPKYLTFWVLHALFFCYFSHGPRCHRCVFNLSQTKLIEVFLWVGVQSVSTSFAVPFAMQIHLQIAKHFFITFPVLLFNFVINTFYSNRVVIYCFSFPRYIIYKN